ncbi:MAG: hypothetical protein ACLQDL_04475 [Spirochaetia bacterium]
MTKTIACLIALVAAASGPVFSQDGAAQGPGLAVTRSVDWAADRIVVEVTRPLDAATPSLVRAKADAETDLAQQLPGALSRALGPLTVDSSHTVADYLAADPGLSARFNDIALNAQRTDLFLTGDLTSLVARYAIPFFGMQGIGSPLYPSKSTAIRRRLGDVTTRAYTGLLIFARGMLPSAGTSRMAVARPALYPRIWDEQMNLVLDKGMCAPEYLTRWGMVGYSQAIDDPAAQLRVGNLPLRLAARGVFGDNDTDIVISMDGARQLLALPENIALLQEGRICIVYDSLAIP